MKKLTFAISLLLAAVILASCGGPQETEVNISDKDNEYINLVYNCVDKWDVTKDDSGKTFSINKISFFNFANQGRIAFFINYPIAGYYGYGYYVNLSAGSMESITTSIYDDSSNWNTTYLARNAATGVDWDSNADKSEKLLKIKEAYKAYLNL